METNPEYETIGANVFQKEEEEAIKYFESVKVIGHAACAVLVVKAKQTERG